MKTFNIAITVTDDADREAVDEALTRGLNDAIEECRSITDYHLYPADDEKTE